MITLIALVLALIFIPSPWNWIVVLVAALIDVLETFVFVRWSARRRRTSTPAVGAEDLVGRRGTAVGPLLPEGQVRVQGEIWAARSRAPVERGGAVAVKAVDGLVLDVEPVGEVDRAG